MKGFAVILLCAFAAVQGRSAGVESIKSAAALGENPWVVHLRIAIGTSGLLETCTGTLIDSRWVLTTASCLTNARFIWIRYGAIDVISPTLVTESSAVRIYPEYDAATGANNIGLISINRNVKSEDNIAPVDLSQSSEVPSSSKVCGYGGDEAPGDLLSCFDVSLANVNGGFVASSDAGDISRFDVGAGLVSDGKQVGIVVGPSDDGAAPVLEVSKYISWIEETADISLGR